MEGDDLLRDTIAIMQIDALEKMKMENNDLKDKLKEYELNMAQIVEGEILKLKDTWEEKESAMQKELDDKSLLVNYTFSVLKQIEGSVQAKEDTIQAHGG